MESDNTEHRRAAANRGGTHLTRWTNSRELEDEKWVARRARAVDLIPAGAVVLDIGCGAMQLEPMLPFACRYLPCDVVARDERTIVVDLNEHGLPDRVVGESGVVVMLGVWEYLSRPAELFKSLARAGKPLVCTYCVTDLGKADRRGEGWVNDFSLEEFVGLARDAGYHPSFSSQVDEHQWLFKFDVAPAGHALPRKRVHVVSYNNIGNFGDRLGFHVLNDVLPPHAEVTWGTLRPFAPVPGNLDLLVLGIGNSLFGKLIGPNLFEATSRARATIGIFGTQYRGQWPAESMHRLLDRLTAWHARYEDDLAIYARGRSNAHHLGDWLINAFPMAVPSIDKRLTVGKEILKTVPLDRTIQHIQQFRRVRSERLHPLLCALTSAEEVGYKEQRETPGSDAVSGKFRSMLMDVFGRNFPEEAMWKVDRDAVVRYKQRVRRATDLLREHIGKLLAP